MRICSNCNFQLNDTASFCKNCGSKVLNQTSSTHQTVSNDPQIQAPQQAPPPQPIQGGSGYSQSQQYAPKKKGGCLKGCLLTVLSLFLVIGILIGLGIFLVPGLVRPVSLGVEMTEQAYKNAHSALGYMKDQSPKEGDRSDFIVKYSGVSPVNASLTSEEITSMLGYNRSVYTKFENPQVRINEDGTVDAAVSVDVGYVFQEILMGKYDESDLKQLIPAIDILPSKVNVQGNIEAKVKNNQLQVTSLNSVKIQGVSLPQSLINSRETHRFIENNINNYIQSANTRTGSSYDLIEARDQELVIEGMFPNSISRIPK